MLPLWQNFKYQLEHDDRMEPQDHLNLIELQAFLLGVYRYNEMERLESVRQLSQYETLEDASYDYNVSVVAGASHYKSNRDE